MIFAPAAYYLLIEWKILVRNYADYFLPKKRPVPEHESFYSVAESLRSFTDLEHLGAGDWAGALSRRSTVFHSDLLWVLHFTFCLALHAIGFHIGSPVNSNIDCTTSRCTHRVYCG